MKRIAVTLILLVFGFTLSYGQIVALKVGPVFSKMEWKNSLVHSTAFEEGYTGFAVIAGMDYLLKKHFCLATDLGYINSGGKGTIITTDPAGNPLEDVEIKTNLHYLTFNTIGHFKFMLGEHIEPFIGLGPRIDYLVGYSEDAKLLKTFEEEDALDKVLYGFVGSAGFHYELEKLSFGVEYQYNFDMNKVVEYESELGVENEVELRCSPLLFTIGYRLGGHHTAEH